MLRGVISPAITVFDNAGKIDYDGNREAIEYLISEKINGILFLGSIGEFFTMSQDEKKQFISFAVKTVAGRVPVLIGTGGTNVDEVAELTRYSEKEGAYGAVVISPYYFNLDDESLYRY
jgi:4-hydroxy-tetrahydrodipicolinate synthase